MNTISGLNTGVMATEIMQMQYQNACNIMALNTLQAYQAQAIQAYALQNYTDQKMADLGWNYSMQQNAMRTKMPADEPKEFWDRMDFAMFPENPVREWAKKQIEQIEKTYRDKLSAIEFAGVIGYGKRNM
ncbi:hypothetical protein [Fournierella sp.]|uniref:hypothetical protein n=1 Tax=Allofournierella sp. TaxID=1940256 RepID=UPI003078D9BD